MGVRGAWLGGGEGTGIFFNFSSITASHVFSPSLPLFHLCVLFSSGRQRLAVLFGGEVHLCVCVCVCVCV